MVEKSHNNISIFLTGSNGFIGKNLSLFLEEKGFIVYRYDRTKTYDYAEEYIAKSDFVIHLAGANRPPNEEGFERDNVLLTERICQIIEKNPNVKIIYASSIQAKELNPYGRSKLKSEGIVKNIKNKSLIYRLPGIYGKWCKPNYNSVVATFCNNIANNKEIVIHSNKDEIHLLYIDDLMESFFVDIKYFLAEKEFPVQPYFETSFSIESVQIDNLAKMIKSFTKIDSEGVLPDFSSSLQKNLYSTYLTYLPLKKASYFLTDNIDERGKFTEFLKGQSFGQFSFFTSKPGVVRGEHYHHTKTEKFLVLNGSARFKFRNLINDEEFELFADDTKSQVVKTIPGWVHSIINVGTNDLVVMLWANEIFDPARPDTIRKTYA